MAQILIVDDSLVMRNILAKCVADLGHEVVGQGKNGNEAIELFNKHKPDTVLLDLTMPNKGGKEALSEIMAAHPDAKVIIFSSVTSEKTKSECMSIGAKAFVNKGINFNDPKQREILLNEVTKILAA